MKLMFFVGKMFATMLIGWLMLLNAQPWLKFGEMSSSAIAYIPALNLLIQIPFLGGWIQFFAANLGAVFGIAVWGVLQFLEILPMAFDKEKVLGGLIEKWKSTQYDSEKEKNAALKKLKEQFNKIPLDDIEALENYRKWAYIIEGIGCFILYCPYQGGLSALISDCPAWDADLILWDKLAMIPISMFGFELLVKLTIRIWRLAKTSQAYSTSIP
jgi:hypothetical protein